MKKNIGTLKSEFNQFPKKTRFVKIGENKWGFQFSKSYFDICDEHAILHETDFTENEYKKGLEKILFIMPEFFDAASNLAEFYLVNNNIKEAEEIYLKYIKFGRSFIPAEFKPETDQMIWAYLDNRPFLRLLHNYAIFVGKYKGISKAIPLLEKIISLNHNDNQGIRDFLSTDYLKVNKLNEMFRLVKHYPSDISPQVVMGGILALIKTGRLKEAEKMLRKNYEFQRHVIKELLKAKHLEPKNLMSDRVTVGGEDEAYYYFLEQGALWTMTKGAIEFLKDFIVKAK